MIAPLNLEERALQMQVRPSMVAASSPAESEEPSQRYDYSRGDTVLARLKEDVNALEPVEVLGSPQAYQKFLVRRLLRQRRDFGIAWTRPNELVYT